MTEGATRHETDSQWDLEAGLARFGFESFLPGQREAVETLLSVGRLLLVAPTGGGKSLTYQLPAAMLPGTTIVVSPLIALMHDQVLALQDRGVPSTYLAGTLDSDEMRRRMSEASRGAYRLIYVAPERLNFGGFRAMLNRLNCPLIAVDEAHCISEWGHDFRPDYMRISELIRDLPDARVLACTATATPMVRDEILDRLGLPADTPQLLKGFARPNLAFRVLDIQSKGEGITRVDLLLKESLGSPGSGRGTAIIYSPTRNRTEAEAARLAGTGWLAEGYHAGMPGAERDRVQTAFAQGNLEIVVATNAFGMGIDRHDVRCIVHLAPPGSVEAYYQEAGRAGRDGKDAVCLLLVSPGDMALRRHLIESDSGGRQIDEATVQHKWSLFLELMRWAEGGTCRHDTILRYFGDEDETLSGCGKCDVCLEMGDGNGANDEEVGTIVRKALCGVVRVNGRFGIGAVSKLLKGAEDERLDWSGLALTPTYGTLAEYPEAWLLALLRRCVTAGWVDFHGGQRPVVVITQEGQDVIRERRPARMLLPAIRSEKVKATAARNRGRKPSAVDINLDARGLELFEALRAWRLEMARKESVPPYVIGSDRTLREIARLRPATESDLVLAHGIGPAKAAKYGDAILALVQSKIPTKN